MNAIKHLRLRQRREATGATLALHARRLGVSVSQLSRLERGHVDRLDVLYLERLKQVYGISDEEAQQAIKRAARRRC